MINELLEVSLVKGYFHLTKFNWVLVWCVVFVAGQAMDG